MKNSQASSTVAPRRARRPACATMMSVSGVCGRAEQQPPGRHHAQQPALVIDDVEVDDPAGRRVLAQPVQRLADRQAGCRAG